MPDPHRSVLLHLILPACRLGQRHQHLQHPLGQELRHRRVDGLRPHHMGDVHRQESRTRGHLFLGGVLQGGFEQGIEPDEVVGRLRSLRQCYAHTRLMKVIIARRMGLG
jgi:hypothetical protein